MAHTRTRQDTRGFLLIMGLFLATAVLTLTTVGLTRSMTDLRVSSRYVTSNQAFQIAEAGLDEGGRWLKGLAQAPTWTDSRDPFTNKPCAEAKPRRLGESRYTVCVDPDDRNPTSSVKLFRIEVVADTAGATPTRRVVSATLRMENFSRFAWFENHDQVKDHPEWGRNWFGSGSYVRGAWHSNGQLSVWDDPIFDGPVSTVASTVNCHSGCPPDNPHFNGGLNVGASRIDLPDPDMDALKDHAALTLSGNTTITLSGPTLLVTNSNRAWADHPVSVVDTPVVFVDSGDLRLTGGTLNGQLTLASTDNIIIEGHVQYACNPEDPLADAADCLDSQTGQVAYNDDVLGLVASKNVRIKSTAPSDLKIQATLMAVQGAFELEGCTPSGCGGTKGKLHVYGGITQNWIGVTGLVGGAGYWEDFSWDNRLQNLTPPYYPMTGRYQSVLWQDEGNAPAH